MLLFWADGFSPELLHGRYPGALCHIWQQFPVDGAQAAASMAHVALDCMHGLDALPVCRLLRPCRCAGLSIFFNAAHRPAVARVPASLHTMSASLLLARLALMTCVIYVHAEAPKLAYMTPSVYSGLPVQLSHHQSMGGQRLAALYASSCHVPACIPAHIWDGMHCVNLQQASQQGIHLEAFHGLLL